MGLFLPKGTKLTYRVVTVDNEDGTKEEVVIVKKTTFDSILQALGFVKVAKTEDNPPKGED